MSFKNTKKIIKNFKTHFYIDLFFELYSHALRSKALFFVYPFVNETIIRLLNLLLKNSRIAGYQVLVKEEKIKVFLISDPTTNQKPIFYSLQGRKRIVTAEMLRKFKYQYPHALVLVETKQGLMDIEDCLRFRCGGEFLVSLM